MEIWLKGKTDFLICNVTNVSLTSTGPERPAVGPAAAADAQVQVPSVPRTHVQLTAQVQPLHQPHGGSWDRTGREEV